MTGTHDDRLLDPLTEREQEILQWLADGLSNEEIGERLFLSTGTIKWHIKNIYSKLAVHKRTAAVMRGRALGLLRADSDDVPPSTPPQKHNLPLQSTAFVGREADAASVLALLNDSACRLITLVGSGGIGKTRLAIHCAAQVIEQFRDGVVFVALESVPSADFLASTIAEALRLHVYDHDNLRSQVINYLRRKNLLLVLDNVEHLLDGAGYIAQIVANAPRVKVLVTSREVLSLNAEWLYPVNGLAVPDNYDDDLEAFGATKLFIDRARQVRNEFSTSAERPWLIRLCQLTGGMPLAIELLTPWLQVLSCHQALQELERNRDLLAAKRRDLPERHHSIRAVFEHSWSLLTAEEQAVFMKLAVFRGGFTREAAEYVASASLITLVSLVNKSLITLTSQARYQLHDLSRHYAEEKLHETPDHGASTYARHSHYYADRLHQLMRAVEAGERILEANDRDMDNTLAGAWYTIRQGIVGEIAVYAEGFWQYFEAHGWYPAESGLIDLYQSAIAVVEADAESHHDFEKAGATLVRLYEGLGIFLYSRRSYAEAETAYQQALKYSAGENRLISARLYRKLANVYMAQRFNSERIHPLFQAAEQALGSEPTADVERWWQEWIQIQLDIGWLYYIQTDLAGITERIAKAETVIERYGTLAQRSKLFHNRALMDLKRYMFHNLPLTTLNYAQLALDAAQQAGNQREAAWLEFSLGFIYLWSGELDAAEDKFLTALDLAEQIGDSMGTQPTTLAYLPVVYRHRQQVDNVEKWAQRGLKLAADANATTYIGVSKAHLGWVSYRRGAFLEAKELCETALRQWAELTSIFPFQWMASVPLLALALDAHQTETAIDYARTILRHDQQQLRNTLPALLHQAVQAWDENQPEVAQAHLHTFCQQAALLGYA